MKSAVEQHCKGQEHLRKVQRKIDGSDRGTKIIESIQAYKDIVKDSTDCQEAVGFERVALNVQVHHCDNCITSIMYFPITVFEYFSGVILTCEYCSGVILTETST